jgi:hypothetical protein
VRNHAPTDPDLRHRAVALFGRLFSWQRVRRALREEPIALVLGFAIAIGGAIGVWYCLGDCLTYGAHPIRTDLEGAVQLSAKRDQWVSIEGAPWRCDQLLAPGGHPYLPARTKDGVLVVVHFQKDVDCEETASEPIAGILGTLSRRTLDELHGAGLAGDDEVARELAIVSFHPRENAVLGVVLCGLLTLGGVFFGPIVGGIGSASAWYRKWVREATRRARSTSPANRTDAIRHRWYLGFISIGGGVACMTMKNWVIWGFVPVPWLGVTSVVLGLLWVAMALTR